jgi:hypothetical protein
MKKKSEQIVDVPTGEILSEDFELLKRSKQNLKLIYEHVKKAYADNGESIGLELRILKGIQYIVVSPKTKCPFNQMYQDDLKKIFESKKLTIFTLAYLARFTPYIKFPENFLVIENHIPNQDELAESLSVRRNKIAEAEKELEYHEIIKKVKSGNNRIVYFNPFLYTAGLVVCQSCFDM